MNKQLLLRLPILLPLILSPQLVADELLIIMAKDSAISMLNNRQLERIFRRQSRFNQMGEHWVPVNLPIDNPLRITFSKKLFKQRPEEMASYWNSQYFKGITPPYVVSSEEAVLRFVANTPNAIGYINACHFDSRVRVLMKFTIQTNTLGRCKDSS